MVLLALSQDPWQTLKEWYQALLAQISEVHQSSTIEFQSQFPQNRKHSTNLEDLIYLNNSNQLLMTPSWTKTL